MRQALSTETPIQREFTGKFETPIKESQMADSSTSGYKGFLIHKYNKQPLVDANQNERNLPRPLAQSNYSKLSRKDPADVPRPLGGPSIGSHHKPHMMSLGGGGLQRGGLLLIGLKSRPALESDSKLPPVGKTPTGRLSILGDDRNGIIEDKGFGDANDILSKYSAISKGGLDRHL